jgi:hypothetical protein
MALTQVPQPVVCHSSGRLPQGLERVRGLALAPRRLVENTSLACDGLTDLAVDAVERAGTGRCERCSWNASSVGTRLRSRQGQSFKIPTPLRLWFRAMWWVATQRKTVLVPWVYSGSWD